MLEVDVQPHPEHYFPSYAELSCKMLNQDLKNKNEKEKQQQENYKKM